MRSPGTELVHIHDAETNRRRIIDLKKAVNTGDSYQETLQEEMLESGINLMEIAEGEDCVEALSGFFHVRQRRVANETGG